MFHFYLRFSVAIFDLRRTPTLRSVRISPVVFFDHKNAGLPLGFPLVHCIEDDTEVSHTCLRYMAAILIFGSDSHRLYTIEVQCGRPTVQ